MRLQEKVLTILSDGWNTLDAEDQKKIWEIVWGMEGLGSNIDDETFKEHCLSPHWSVDSQINFINTKFERLQ